MLKLLTVASRKRNQLVDFSYSYLQLVDLGLVRNLHVPYICTCSEEVNGSEGPIAKKNS